MLKKRPEQAIQFKRELPSFLGNGDGPVFIIFNARPGGPVNPEYMAAMEQQAMNTQVSIRQNERIEDDASFITADSNAAKKLSRGRLVVLFDTCVTDWQTDIVDEHDKPLATSGAEGRQNFLELIDVKGYPEITQAILDLEKEVLEAGRITLKNDEDVEKN